MTIEHRLQRLEQLLAATPDAGPSPLCSCYPTSPTFRSEAELKAAQQQECPLHGKRFRYCLVTPISLTEKEWTERKIRLGVHRSKDRK